MHAGYLPGYPASHGCIRLPEKMAVQFFNNAAVGTPVEIRPTGEGSGHLP
jgi:lipoprotein-anchoring transpeptidase ErfK/SrfK